MSERMTKSGPSLVLLVLAACGGVQQSPGADCGAGTILQGSVCVGRVACGAGTVESAGYCAAAVRCGAQTELQDGQCVPKSSQPSITCGSGTSQVGSQCLAPAPVACGGGTEKSGNECVGTLRCAAGTKQEGSQCVVDVPPASTHKRVFVTRTAYYGNLGSIANADAQCQIAADAAGLKGTFKAWLSDASTHAIDRIAEVGAWHATGPGDEMVFGSRANLRGYPLVPIARDEYGALVPAGRYIFTGTSVTGVRTGSDCTGWTSQSTSVYATVGTTGSTSTAWTNYSTGSCFNGAQLLCLQQ